MVKRTGNSRLWNKKRLEGCIALGERFFFRDQDPDTRTSRQWVADVKAKHPWIKWKYTPQYVKDLKKSDYICD